MTALTKRETQVLSRLIEGRSNSEIARVVHLSTATVKRTVASLLMKSMAPNRLALAVWYVRQNPRTKNEPVGAR
jgi:DNA-binding NarL/FixJ family response regulator